MEKMTDLPVQMTQLEAKRNAKPSYCLIDSQSTKQPQRLRREGLMAEKNQDRKRHIITDVLGNLLKVVVVAANIHDTIAGCGVFRSALQKYSSLQGVCGDAGFRGTFVDFVLSLGKKCDISEKIVPKGWKGLPKRWCVERTFGWFVGFRRLSKDYEISTGSEENMIMIAHSTILLRRLCY
jgi:putative transposase